MKLVKESLEEELNESIKRNLEKYADIAWKNLQLRDKIEALHAIGVSGSGQAMKKLSEV